MEVFETPCQTADRLIGANRQPRLALLDIIFQLRICIEFLGGVFVDLWVKLVNDDLSVGLRRLDEVLGKVEQDLLAAPLVIAELLESLVPMGPILFLR